MQQWPEHLNAVEAAAGQLVQGCQAMRAAMSSSQTDDGAGTCEQAQEALVLAAEAELQEAAAGLRRLLDSMELFFSRRDSTPDEAPPSPLLALPKELLARVARLAGKDARPVCTALAEAYGCPGTTLRHPPPGSAAGLGDRGLSQLIPLRSQFVGPDDLQLEVFWESSEPSPALLRMLERCRGSAWAAQVTRLELWDHFTPGYSTMQLLSSSLPSLRELKCPWWLSGNEPMPTSSRAPVVFTALTALTALCSVQQVVSTHLVQYVERFGRSAWCYLHNIMPSLRKLEADLRQQEFCELAEGVDELHALTHLAVRFADGINAGHAARLLAEVAERLRSLNVQSSANNLYDGGAMEMEPGAVIGTMRHLTSLQLAIACRDFVFPSWAQLPHMHQLLLGYTMTGDSWQLYHNRNDIAAATGSFQTGPPPKLRVLSLAVLAPETADADADPDLPRLLAPVQQCTALTRLEAGLLSCGALTVQWLQPVAALQQLQQLALALNVADMGQLGCLSQLALLKQLWLHLLVIAPVADAPGAAPTSAVEALTSLATVHGLTLVVDTGDGGGGGGGGCNDKRREPPSAEYADSTAAALLAAAVQLPRLEVLDTVGLVTTASSRAVWKVLDGVPVAASLRQLQLRCSRHLFRGGAQLQLLAEVAAEVRALLSPRVQVAAVVEEYPELESGWSVMKPWSLQRRRLAGTVVV